MEDGDWKPLVTVTLPMTKKQGSVYMDALCSHVEYLLDGGVKV